MPIMPRSPGITRIDRSGRTTRPSETAIMVRCIRSMHSAIGSNWRTSGPRSSRISMLAGSERGAQLFHRSNEGFDIIVIVVEMKAGAHIVIAVRRNDVMLHQLRGQPRAVARGHGHGGAAALILRRSDARPTDFLETLHTAPRQRVIPLGD